MEKNEILANMYALRAGLSVVSINSKKIEKKLGEVKKQAKDDEKRARDEKKKTEKKMDEHRQARIKSEEDLETRKARKKRARKDGAKWAGSTALCVVIGFALLAAGLALIAVFAYFVVFWVMSFGAFGDPPTNDFILTLYSWTFKYIEGEYPEDWFMWTMIGCTALGIGAAILGFFLAARALCDGYFTVSKRSVDTVDDLPAAKELKEDIVLHASLASGYGAQLAVCDAHIDEAKKKGKELIAATCAELQPLSSATMAFYNALCETFTPILDERDWDNLDLITYYIETGRADTVKESLLLLDRQKQTDQIVGAINEAAGAICRTVNDGLRRLQNDMRKCFNILSDQISAVGNMVNNVGKQVGYMSNRMSAMESTIADQNSRIAEMASVSNLNKALASCASDNSSQLVAAANTCAQNSKYIADSIRQAQIGGR